MYSLAEIKGNSTRLWSVCLLLWATCFKKIDFRAAETKAAQRNAALLEMFRPAAPNRTWQTAHSAHILSHAYYIPANVADSNKIQLDLYHGRRQRQFHNAQTDWVTALHIFTPKRRRSPARVTMCSVHFEHN
jgi:hypothetical protein